MWRHGWVVTPSDDGEPDGTGGERYGGEPSSVLTPHDRIVLKPRPA